VLEPRAKLTKFVPHDPNQAGCVIELRHRASRAPQDERPDRLTVPTCIGCGAMSRFGTCDTGCSEQKLELVPATAYDSLAALQSGADMRADAFRTVADELAWRQPAADEWETSYRSVQEDARHAAASTRPNRASGSASGDPSSG
jgi:hypothetical protein